MFFIRTDASPSIGMGHVMRCLAIAQEIRRLDKEVTFIVSNEYSLKILEDRKFKYVIVPNKSNIIDEISEYGTIFSKTDKNVILVDSYRASDAYLNRLSQFADVYFIDGLLKCNADITGIICFNPSANQEEYENRYGGKKTILMIGSEYVPLRDEFKSRKRQKSLFRKQVLLTTGSTDNLHITETFCSVWSKLNLCKKADLHVIIGGLFNEIDWIGEYQDIHFLQNVHNMSEIMSNIDIAVCQAGTTVFELLSQGIPTIAFAINDVQNTFSALEPKIRWAGYIQGYDGSSLEIINNIVANVIELLDHQDEIEKMESEIIQCFDGEGAARIAKIIQDNSLQ